MNESTRSIFSPVNIVAMLSLLAASLWLAWWFYDRTQYLYVTDARIASTLVSVSSRIPGWVVGFPVKEGERLLRGEVLVEIDTRDVKLQLAEIDAGLSTVNFEQQRLESEIALRGKQIDSSIEVARSRHEAALFELSESHVLLGQANSDYKRASSLLKQNMLSEGTWEARRTGRDMAIQAQNRSKAKVGTAAAELSVAEINVAELEVLQHQLKIVGSKRDELTARRMRLQNTLDDLTIKSPIDGVIDETFVNRGEYVYPGQRILMLHNPEDVWIKANIKETNISKLHEGATVEVSVDAFPNEVFSARVGNIGHAATSAFALLPSPNPSGNFTKTTQRIEVKMKLDPHERELKPGMMVELKIDTR